MLRTTYNYESLDRHGVTEQEADEVYATGYDLGAALLEQLIDGHLRGAGVPPASEHARCVRSQGVAVKEPHPYDFDLDPRAHGNDRIMVVGWTSAGRLLEVGIEYLPDGNEHIFHARDATKTYRELFEKDMR